MRLARIIGAGILALVAGALAFVASAAALYWVLSEAVVLFEVWHTGAASRAELGRDLGLGILAFAVVLPGTLVGASLMAGLAMVWIVWPRSAAPPRS